MVEQDPYEEDKLLHKILASLIQQHAKGSYTISTRDSSQEHTIVLTSENQLM